MLRRLYESPFVRFAVVGGVATAVNYAVYVVLVRCFDNLWPALAYFCAFCVSIVCNFLLSSYFTFRVRPSGPPCRAVPDGPPHQPCERTRTARNLAVGGRSETLCAAVRFSGRLSGQFPDGALRPARAFEILKKRTLPCDARQGLLLHLFGCSLGYFLILGSSSPYFFFRSSALSHSPSSIASTPHATKISIGRV